MSDTGDNKAFVIYKDWEEVLKCFNDAEVGLLFRALFSFAIRSESPELPRDLKIAFTMMSSAIKRDSQKYKKKCEARAAAGKASAEKRKALKLEQEQNSGGNQSASPKEPKPKPKAKPKPKPKALDYDDCVSFGEYRHVQLNLVDYEKLVDDFGMKKVDEYIKRVDEYVQQTGKSYKDYNLTIRKWIYDDAKASSGSGKGENSSLDMNKIEQALSDKYRKKEKAPADVSEDKNITQINAALNSVH